MSKLRFALLHPPFIAGSGIDLAVVSFEYWTPPGCEAGNGSFLASIKRSFERLACLCPGQKITYCSLLCDQIVIQSLQYCSRTCWTPVESLLFQHRETRFKPARYITFTLRGFHTCANRFTPSWVSCPVKPLQ